MVQQGHLLRPCLVPSATDTGSGLLHACRGPFPELPSSPTLNVIQADSMPLAGNATDTGGLPSILVFNECAPCWMTAVTGGLPLSLQLSACMSWSILFERALSLSGDRSSSAYIHSSTRSCAGKLAGRRWHLCPTCSA